LGQDIIKLKFENLHVINQQKVRVDLFLDWIDGAERPKPDVVWSFLLRKDVFPFIEQQAGLPWLRIKKSNNLILMDSFSELTDQKFISKKEGWAFCCNYNDIDHSPLFEDEFDCQGLLNLSEIEHCYKVFFDYINKEYPSKKILFLHFPTKLDQRQLFKDRGVAIKNALEKLSLANKSIINVHVPDEKVSPYEEDDFPYHFGRETYLHFVKEINQALDANN